MTDPISLLTPPSSPQPDGRRSRITVRLGKLVGPGIGGFYKDACALMDDPHRFSSTIHLVSHLMREIESALRDVLQPLAQVAGVAGEPTKEEKEEAHKFEITSILTLLDIPLDNDVAQKWLSHAGTYPTQAHRKDLGVPLPFASFVQSFDEFEGILDYVLNRTEAKYTWVFVRIDELAAKVPATEADMDILLKTVPQDVVALGRFFEKAADPSWLTILRNHEMYANPPEPEIDLENGTMSFPFWPQMQLLIRLAPVLPDEVVETVNNIPATDNGYVNAAIVDVARAVPTEKISSLLSRLVTTLGAKYRIAFPFQIGELIGKLSDAGDHDVAMDLAKAVLSFEDQSVLDQDNPNSEILRGLREPRLRIDEHLYGDILQRQVPRLVQEVGGPTIAMLASLLEEAITTPLSDEMMEGHTDYSSIWCREVSPEGLTHNLGIKTHLTSALRDGVISRVQLQPQEMRSHVEGLEAHLWPIFRRLALNLLRVHGSLDLDMVQERLVDPNILGDYQCRPEYDRLLAAHFASLPNEAQNTILALIEAEPDIENHAGWVREFHGREPTEDETQAFVEMALLERLAPIAHILPEPWTIRYQQFLEAHGPHSSRVLPTGGGFVGAKSPATAEEIASLDVEVLITYLVEFVPTGSFFDPSKSGLASTLTDVVAANPNRYLPFAERFSALDIEYVNGVLNGLVRAASDGSEVDWDAALDFCEAIVRIPRTTFDGGNNQWGWTRLEVLRLLSTGLKSTHPLQTENESRVFSIIESISDDPHPTPADEAESSMSADDLALNSVRSRAIETAIEYGVWMYRHDPGSSFDDIITLIDRHLDPTVDPSVAVRSVIGRNFSNLLAFDATWAATAADHIFPDGEESKHLWTAAWDGYLWRGLLNKPTWLALADQYALAVRRVEPDSEERRQQWRDQSLANHLLNLYWAGEIGINEGLFADLLIVADETLCHFVLETVGRGIAQNSPTIDQAVLDRLLALWESRVDVVRVHPSGELAAFGWWMNAERIPVELRLQGLHDALSLSGHAEPAHQVVEQLAKMSAERPREAAELLGILTDAEIDGWRFTLWDTSASQIIKTALTSADQDAANYAREAASRAAVRGHPQWLDYLAAP